MSDDLLDEPLPRPRSTPVEQHCGNCVYWSGRRNDGAWASFFDGNCRRRAPVYDAFEGMRNYGHSAKFPIVKGDNWCGEWEHAPNAKEI